MSATQPTKPSLRSRTDLLPRQLAVAKAIEERGSVAVFMKPGGGKTAATLEGLLRLNLPEPVLVVAPVRVTENVWAQEAAEWEHLAHWQFAILRGTPKKRAQLLAGKADVFVINYELLPWLIKTLGRDLTCFSAIVFDELSMMKKPGTVRFRALRHLLDQVPVRIGLTGTPTGNTLLNLWGELFCIHGAAPYGSSYARWKADLFYPVDEDRFVWVPRPGTQEKLLADLPKWAVSVEVEDPTEVIFNTVRFTLPRAARQMYDELQVSRKIEGMDVRALVEVALSTKVRQISAGWVYDSQRKAQEIHQEKVAAVQELRDELQGNPLLAFYEYDFEREYLLAMGGTDIREKGAVDAWSKGQISLLVAHPKAGGHGLNLQHGGADLVFVTLPRSWELYSQCIGRLARTGQESPVTVHTIAAADTIEDDVAAALRDHARTEKLVFDAAS